MRTDESGNPCPATLGEYRDLCRAIGGPNCRAVKFLNQKIEEEKDGEKAIVLVDDFQMRMLLMPMLCPEE